MGDDDCKVTEMDIADVVEQWTGEPDPSVPTLPCAIPTACVVQSQSGVLPIGIEYQKLHSLRLWIEFWGWSYTDH